MPISGATVNRNELRVLGGQLLEQPRALRAAFPDRGDMSLMAISDVRMDAPDNDPGAGAFSAALGHLHTEMAFVRDGKTHDLTVMDDESIQRRERFTTHVIPHQQEPLIRLQLAHNLPLELPD
jgi:hypothetical protein